VGGRDDQLDRDLHRLRYLGTGGSEVAAAVAGSAEPGGLADAIRQALAQRERLAAAGLERARLFSWEETARRTLDVYREALAR